MILNHTHILTMCTASLYHYFYSGNNCQIVKAKTRVRKTQNPGLEVSEHTYLLPVTLTSRYNNNKK